MTKMEFEKYVERCSGDTMKTVQERMTRKWKREKNQNNEVQKKKKWEGTRHIEYKNQVESITNEKERAGLCNGHPNSKTKFLIASQNICIKKNYVKAKIQKNIKKNGRANLITRECSKLAKKETRQGRISYILRTAQTIWFWPCN